MLISRRGVLAISAGFAGLAMLPISVQAQDAAAAPTQTADEMIAEFTGGAEVAEGDGVKLTAPEIAENGNTVPISVEAPGASEILLIATENPTPGVAKFIFGPLAASQAAATRIRLAKTQDVVAVAKLADGSFVRTAANVKVTIGGCGG
ncbi:thiosulfate oxidation carrier protein SoxY [Paracoccus benzoatiresistens]|uniref:Thiosulfate oxidation carrier protein SoxY n=1 Tax=Paracoccus benzoatiresistens TaxID=2997341 RepID=A0ABT4J964_9RHOB|nr:thiosulfate oxidation carrier protein SoxY [Paracoccus sp. EF6]MCZ0963628.1 thiosulfate oxidation carrier protein SoxY [Paracoccus sp. EF6]